MRDLIIVCEDFFGLDVKNIAMSMNDYGRSAGMGDFYHIKGFIVPKDARKDVQERLQPILGTIEDWNLVEDVCFAMGIVQPQNKQSAVEHLKSKGARFVTLWAPWVMAHLDMKFPEGCIIAAQSIMDSAKIGKFVTLFYSMVGFDANVEAFSSVMAFSNITTSHVGERAFIGDNTVVIGSSIGDDAVVMPGSVVVKNVKPGQTVFGNPAKRIKKS